MQHNTRPATHLSFLGLGLIALLLWGSTHTFHFSVQAQSPSPSASGSPNIDPPAFSSPSISPGSVPLPSPSDNGEIFQKSQLTEKREKLRAQYRGEVEAYRRAEQEFIVAKGQYEQVKTLTALENAVRKTKTVMLSRTTLLQVYMELLQTILLDTPGVNISRREVVSSDITALLIDLKAHQQILEGTNDRDGVNARADEFALFSKQIVSAAQKAHVLIAIGKIQNVSDVADIIHEDIIEMHKEASVSGLRQQERDRASKEIDRNFVEVSSQLQELNVKAQEAEIKVVSESYLAQTLERLNSGYAKLQQILSYLEELLKY